jgi:hypothetical protein
MSADGEANDPAAPITGRQELADALVALAPSELQRLLIDVHRRATSDVTPAEVLRRFRRDRFSRPAASDPRAITRVLAAAFDLLPAGSVALAVAPVAPLGTTVALTNRGQGGVLSTDRTLEIVGDTAGVLALEAAVRRDAARRADDEDAVIRLAASQRVLRTQPFPEPYRQHFELFALATAGRAAPAFGFETAALAEQIGFHVALATAICGDEGRVSAEIADLDRPGGATRLEDRVCEPLRRRHPAARIAIDRARTRGAGYYAGAAFRICVGTGERDVEIADGGLVDWARRLLGDRRERLVVSGLGVEQLASVAAGPGRRR